MPEDERNQVPQTNVESKPRKRMRKCPQCGQLYWIGDGDRHGCCDDCQNRDPALTNSP